MFLYTTCESEYHVSVTVKSFCFALKKNCKVLISTAHAIDFQAPSLACEG